MAESGHIPKSIFMRQPNLWHDTPCFPTACIGSVLLPAKRGSIQGPSMGYSMGSKCLCSLSWGVWIDKGDSGAPWNASLHGPPCKHVTSWIHACYQSLLPVTSVSLLCGGHWHRHNLKQGSFDAGRQEVSSLGGKMAFEKVIKTRNWAGLSAVP